MTRIILAAMLSIPMGCAAIPPTTADLQTRKAPIETVRVTVANVEIPVTVATIPLHSSLERSNSPTREHIRKLLLSARSP